MLDRRSFLQSSLAAGLGLLAPGRSAVASPCASAYLGNPPSWSFVRQGLHPIAPERVVVLTEHRLSRRQHHLAQGLSERFHGRLSTEKIAWIARLSKVLADHYRIPVERWAFGMAKREALGSTGLGYGAGLLHQFQDFRHPSQDCYIAKAPVDWWLFLFPEGVEWDAFDGRPVFGMIGHVFASFQPSLQLRAYILTTQAAGAITLTGQEMDPTAWQRLSRLDRIRAARRVNSAVWDRRAGMESDLVRSAAQA